MMRLSTLPATLLVSQACLTLGAPGLGTRDSIPKLPYDQNTTPHCTWSLDYEAKVPCSDILRENLITIDTFSRWVGSQRHGLHNVIKLV